MQDNSYPIIRKLLAGTDPVELKKGLDLVKRELAEVGSDNAGLLLEMICALFYIDALDHPDLISVIAEAVSLVKEFGEQVIPDLIQKLDTSDVKAELAVAHALGRIGDKVIEPLMAEYKSSNDPELKIHILYTFGKIKSPKVVHVANLVLEGAKSPDLQLRDTAIRVIGKFAEAIPPSQLPGDLCEAFVSGLKSNLSDINPGIRAKAVRSLGKLARSKHLTDEDCEKLKKTCQLILGTDENYRWDRAYIVRKEAEEALQYV